MKNIIRMLFKYIYKLSHLNYSIMEKIVIYLIIGLAFIGLVNAASDVSQELIKAGIIFGIAFILYIVYLIFWILIIIDNYRREFSTKLKWLLLNALLPFGFVFYYFMIKRKDIHSKNKPKPVESLSSSSFIISVISFSAFPFLGFLGGPISIILGVMGKNKIKQKKLAGKELADAGIILGIISIILIL